MLVLKIIATVCLTICLFFFITMTGAAVVDESKRDLVKYTFLMALTQVLGIVTIWVI